MNEFKSPVSIREARERIFDLQEDIKKIEQQLSDRNMVDKNGKRLSNTKYHKWRRNALKALHLKTQELRLVKYELRSLLAAEKAHQIGLSLTTCEGLLFEANRILQSTKDELDLSDKDQYVLDLIRDHVIGML